MTANDSVAARIAESVANLLCLPLADKLHLKLVLGNDAVVGNAGDDTTYGGQGNDTFVADLGNDLIYGNFGDDVLNMGPSGTGNDTLYGGQGNDLLIEASGEAGVDRMFGNLGADTFDFSRLLIPSGQISATADQIADFSSAQGDKIAIHVTGTVEFQALSNSSVNSVESAITAANNVSAFGTSDVVFVAGSTNGYLLVDQNDDGTFGSSTDFAVVLQNVTSFSITDINGIFMVIPI